MPILPLQTPLIPENLALGKEICHDLQNFEAKYGKEPLPNEEEAQEAEKALRLINEKTFQLFQNEYAYLQSKLMLAHLLRLDIFFNDYAAHGFLHSFLEALYYDLDTFDLWHIHHTANATPASLKGYWTSLIKLVDVLPKYEIVTLEQANQMKKHIRQNKSTWVKRMEEAQSEDEEVKNFFLRARGYS